MKFPACLFFSIVLVCFACSDDQETGNDLLIGQWELTSIYEGYANGGNSAWNDQPNDFTETIEFTAHGKYVQRQESASLLTECAGSFKHKGNNKFNIKTNCGTVQMKISELTHTVLIIDYQGFEGVIRYKYTRIP